MPSTAAAPVAAPAPAPAASKNSLLAPKQTWDEQFNVTDFSDKEAIISLFPAYMQETIAIRKANKKGVTNAINVECFTLKTPFGDQTLLKNTKLIIENNKRLGLVGANCTGKTLLFNNISERLIKEVPKHLHIHHCKEFESHELHDSVLNTVVNGYPYRRILVQCEAKLRSLLAAEPAPSAELKEKLENNLEFIVMSMKSIRGYEAEERAAKMLRVLGFDDIGMKKLVSALSGGLRMRVALCLAFFIEADLLLLDEPTNHLDFPSVLWLENRLRGYKGSFVMVSHDRELLNNVCQSVMLLEDKVIKYYHMGFKEFEKKKAEEDKKKSDEIEKFLKRNPNADPSTPLGKEKAEKKEWMDSYNRKQVALAGKFTFPISSPLENTEVGPDGQPINPDDIALIDLKDVRFSYNVETGHFIFNDPISFKVTATTRVGVMGPNGAGKSTLLKLLTHKLIPTNGTVTHHPKFNLAYFGQHSTAELNLEMTAIEFMQSQFPEEKAGNLRSHLAKTSIVGPVADTRIKSLSFSQRSCVVFAKLTYVAPHLLILDEPTNFLDLESVDALIMACNKYKGALLLVSHNRDFLRKCAKQYLSVVPGQFKLFDRLKEAENATYSFIAEMEEGVKVGAGDLVKNNPGGGSVHHSQKTDGSDEKKDAAGPKVITFGGSGSSTPLPKYNAGGATPAPKPAAAAAPAKGAAAAKDGKKEATPAPAPAKKDAAPAAAPAAAAAPADGAAPTYVADEKVQAQWKDGKWYAAVIKKVNAKGDFTVLYTEYGNTSNLTADKIRKLPAPAAKKQ